jgi:hypothetical protein
MSKFLDVLFGCCTHDRYTFPMSVKPGQRRSEAAGVTGIYVVCVNCGKEFAYSWDEMRVVPANPASAAVADSSRAASIQEALFKDHIGERYRAARLQAAERI